MLHRNTSKNLSAGSPLNFESTDFLDQFQVYMTEISVHCVAKCTNYTQTQFEDKQFSFLENLEKSIKHSLKQNYYY